MTLGEGKLPSMTVQKYPCLYDKSHRFHKEKNVVQNAWEAVTDELDFIFYPFFSNVPFQYSGMAKLSHRF